MGRLGLVDVNHGSQHWVAQHYPRMDHLQDKQNFFSPLVRSQNNSRTHISTASPTINRTRLQRLHTVKMAPERAADTTHCAILTPPDELLLEVVNHLPHLPRDRRSDLLALSAVNKRIGSIAIEQLHTKMYLNIQNIEILLRLYIARPEMARLVKSRLV